MVYSYTAIFSNENGLIPATCDMKNSHEHNIEKSQEKQMHPE